MEDIAQRISDGIFIISRDLRILWANQAVLDATGYTMEQIIGKTCYEVTHRRDTPCQPPQAVCPIDEVKRTGRPYRVQHTHFDKHGGKVFVEVEVHPIKDRDGEYRQYIHVTRDLTDVLWADEELAKAHKELQDLNQMKIDIISNLSHELRTPLTVAQGSVELALTKDDPEMREELLKRVLRSLDRQNHIIENLVTLSLIYAENLKLFYDRVELRAIIEKALNALDYQVRQKSISCNLSIPEDLPQITADQNKLYLAILNLIDNAVKFNKVGGTVDITARCQDGNIVLAVADQGEGIDPEDVAVIFEPLTQLDHSIRRRYGGTGTGLTVAKHIVELHNGRIWVEENPGGGSIFYVSLPVDGA